MSANFIMRLFNRFLLVMLYLGVSVNQASAAPVFETGYKNTQYGFDSNAIVAIKITGKKDFCSGVVVGANEVLTATHCVYGLKAQTYYPSNTVKIGVGDNVLHDSVQWFDVAKISPRSSATIKTVSDFLGNDIVSLTSTKTLPVTPVPIVSYTSKNIPLTAWGFGEDEWAYYGIKKSRPLENAALDEKLISFSSGACRGDSGGPVLNTRNEVVAIISVSKVPHCVDAGKRIAQRITSGLIDEKHR